MCQLLIIGYLFNLYNMPVQVPNEHHEKLPEEQVSVVQLCSVLGLSTRLQVIVTCIVFSFIIYVYENTIYFYLFYIILAMLRYN